MLGATKKKAIVTYNFANYDSLKEPAVITDGWDYLVVSDGQVQSDAWRSVRVPALQSVICPKRRSSILKIASHRYVPDEYDLVVTLDASMRINCDLDEFVGEFHSPDSDLTLARHPKRQCLYDEADAVIKLQYDDPDLVGRQISRYRSDGFPERRGLYGTRMMVKNHRSSALRELCDVWAEEYMTGSRRDQLSLTYSIWKLGQAGLKEARITAFDFNEVYRRRHLFEITTHLGSRRWP